MEPQIRYARTSDGVSIAWYSIGEGMPFVGPYPPPSHVAHSLAMSELQRTHEEFTSRGSRLIAYDARGFGLSDRGPMDQSLDAMVRDMEAVVDSADIDRFCLHSVSIMAMPGLAYASRHPERVLAIIMPGGIVRGAEISERWRRLVRLAAEDWEDAKLTLARDDQGWALSVASLEQRRMALDDAATQAEFLAFAEAMAAWDVSGQLPSITTPALVVHYAGSKYTPLEASRRLAASLPNGAFALVNVRDPGYAAAGGPATRSFLRRVLGPRPRPEAPPEAGPASGTAVILFTDIAESAALTERLGDDAFRAAARELDSRLRTAIRDANGTPIEGKRLGDGLLATFSSARDALGAARRCVELSADSELRLHVGLHAGDITREDGDVYGGAVNIAARICDLCEPGELLVSATVRDLARTSSGVAFEDRGEQQLKGIADSVRVFAVSETK